MDKIVPILIPLYYSYHLVERFIKSVELEKETEYQIVFIDNTSYEDKNTMILEKLNLTLKNSSIIISPHENLYYTGSIMYVYRNFDSYFKDYEIDEFIIMNPDCFPLTENWITEMRKGLRLGKNIATVGTIQYSDENKRNIWHCGCSWKGENEQKCHLLDWRHNNIRELVDYMLMNKKSAQVDGNTGTGIMLDRKIFEELNGFDDKKYPHYSSDADYCLRATQNGYIHICSYVEMYHNPGKSVKK